MHVIRFSTLPRLQLESKDHPTSKKENGPITLRSLLEPPGFSFIKSAMKSPSEHFEDLSGSYAETNEFDDPSSVEGDSATAKNLLYWPFTIMTGCAGQTTMDGSMNGASTGTQNLIRLASFDATGCDMEPTEFSFASSGTVEPDVPLDTTFDKFDTNIVVTVIPRRGSKRPTTQDWERWRPMIMTNYKYATAQVIIEKIRSKGFYVT